MSGWEPGDPLADHNGVGHVRPMIQLIEERGGSLDTDGASWPRPQLTHDLDQPTTAEDWLRRVQEAREQ